MTVLNLVGARPQFIKAAVVARVLRTTLGVEEAMRLEGSFVIAHVGVLYQRRDLRVVIAALKLLSERQPHLVRGVHFCAGRRSKHPYRAAA